MNVEGALIAIEPFSGYIRTMVGGSNFEVQNQYNRAVQARRQPGSAFKPFVYGAAIENRLVTTETVPSRRADPGHRRDRQYLDPGQLRGRVPRHGPGEQRPVCIASTSYPIRLYDILGPDKIIDFASRMTKVPPTDFGANPTLALGTTELTPFEMATGFAVYANRGKDVIPFAVRYVVDRDGNEVANIEGEVGEILARKSKNGTIQVISEDVAWIMTQMMARVVDSGTATEGIRIKGGYTKKGAGKTGTTSNWSDAWFCGYTPDIAAVVWVGYDQSFLSLGNAPGRVRSGRADLGPVHERILPWTGRIRNSGQCRPGSSSIGTGWGLEGAQSQYYDTEGDEVMKSVLERYMEIEGMIEEKKPLQTVIEDEAIKRLFCQLFFSIFPVLGATENYC